MAYDDDIPPDVIAARRVRSLTKTPSDAIKAFATLAAYNTDSSIDHIANIARDFPENKKVTMKALSTLATIKGEVASTSIYKIARDIEGAKLAGLVLLAGRTDDKATVCIKEIGRTSDEKIALAALFYLDSRLGPEISNSIGEVGLRNHKAADSAFDILERRADPSSIRNIYKLGEKIEGMERHAFQTLFKLGHHADAAQLVHNVLRENPIQALGIVLSNDFLRAQSFHKNKWFGYPGVETVETIFSDPDSLLEVVRNSKDGIVQLSTILARAADEKLDTQKLPLNLKDMQRRVSSCEVYERNVRAEQWAFEKAFN